jgi:hypothetical protein
MLEKKEGDFTVKYGQLNDSLSTGWRGEYRLVDAAGDEFTANRTASAYAEAHEAQEEALKDGIARAKQYAAATAAQREKMIEEDEQDMYARGFVPPV